MDLVSAGPPGYEEWMKHQLGCTSVRILSVVDVFFFVPNSFWLIVMNWRTRGVHFRWTESVLKTCWLKCFSAACAFVVIAVCLCGYYRCGSSSRNILVVLSSLYLSLICSTLPGLCHSGSSSNHCEKGAKEGRRRWDQYCSQEMGLHTDCLLICLLPICSRDTSLTISLEAS